MSWEIKMNGWFGELKSKAKAWQCFKVDPDLKTDATFNRECL